MTFSIWFVVSGAVAMSVIYGVSAHLLTKRAYWIGYADGMRRGRQAAGDGRVTVEQGDDGVMNVMVELHLPVSPP